MTMMNDQMALVYHTKTMNVHSFQVQLNEEILENEHPVGEECVFVDASVVDTLRTQRVEEELENEASDSEDETRWQYISDDEGPAIPHDDEDDDSDLD